ncbi:MAG: hypothetical protein ACLUB2_00800 [Butyricicoccus pullicaecorum]
MQCRYAVQLDAASPALTAGFWKNTVVWAVSASVLGSDAHRARDIGRGFDVYVDYIRSLGFDHLTVFRNRQAQAYPI